MPSLSPTMEQARLSPAASSFHARTQTGGATLVPAGAEAAPRAAQGNIAKWYVKAGEPFSAGDILADIETDKATMGWESQDDGVMAKIITPEGSKDIPVGTVVALSVDDESELSKAESYTPGGDGGGGGVEHAAAPDSGGGAAASDGGGGGGGSFPPHQVWTMPALSPTMTQGNIATWHKKVGDELASGDAIVDVETDKSTMTWETVEDGFVAKILAPDGTQDLAVRSLRSRMPRPAAWAACSSALGSNRITALREALRSLVTPG